MTLQSAKFFDFSSVTILTTDQCTAKCDHCCVSSSPDRRAKLTFDDIKAQLDALRSEHDIKLVVFAGGEPSLLKDHLVKAIQYCTDNKILSRVVTNASWAIDNKRTDAMLRKWRDAGLCDLNISADDYHLPWVPLDRLKRIWDRAQGVGFNAVIVAVAYQQGSQVTYESLRTLFEDPDIPLVYDENGKLHELAPLRAQDGTLYAICQRPASRSGRGLKLIDTDDVVFLGGKSEYSPCPWIRTSPAISPKGELVSCCGFETRRVKTLNYGKLSDDTMDDITKCSDDVLLHALTLIGPKTLLEFVKKKNGSASFDKHVSMCEACEDLMSKPDNIKVLREHAAEIAAWAIASAERQSKKKKKVTA